ncbi:TetR/AcrR family transcriptional regulator [Paenibacillus peoriae]|uniref:TetR/AcrR family transcriptional regulator n=1 Tax=Paenibacillus peoriae TaxID=59893 RepID=UPI00026C6081|nr:TetR/AcrR family transcriptional regulator [Paenibacillus peoriae]MEC0184736.1 TetR/AcrR family transcriptional regulator [Paenibacillus peoriae]
MTTDKVDLRIIKTRKAIKESFVKLIQSKGYERITVQDIADEAMINRNTFYLHYVDKPDLMDKLCQQSLEKLNVCLNVSMSIHEPNKEMFIAILKNMFEIIERDIVFFKAMLSQNGQTSFSNQLKEALKMFMLSGLGEYRHDTQITIGIEYMLSGLVGVICLWVVGSENYLVDEIIEQLSEIHYSNVLELLKLVANSSISQTAD